jgi:hypothetical protein
MNSSRFFFFPKAKQNKNPKKQKSNKNKTKRTEETQGKKKETNSGIEFLKQSKANGESENVPQKPSKSKFQLPRGKKPDEKVKMNKGIIDYEL